jgi:hypothetical protein
VILFLPHICDVNQDVCRLRPVSLVRHHRGLEEFWSKLDDKREKKVRSYSGQRYSVAI